MNKITKIIIGSILVISTSGCQIEKVDEAIIQHYQEDIVSMTENPVLIIPMGRHLFSLVEYNTLRYVIYQDYFSDEFCSFSSFLRQCLLGNENRELRVILPVYHADKRIINDSRDYSAFIGKYLIHEKETVYFTRMDLFDPTILWILFRSGHTIDFDDYRGVFLINTNCSLSHTHRSLDSTLKYNALKDSLVY